MGKGIGHFFGALDIEGFRDKVEFKKDIDEWIYTLRSTKPMSGTEGVKIPGDPEREAYLIRMEDGVPVNKLVVATLQLISDETGINLHQ